MCKECADLIIVLLDVMEWVGASDRLPVQDFSDVPLAGNVMRYDEVPEDEYRKVQYIKELQAGDDPESFKDIDEA